MSVSEIYDNEVESKRNLRSDIITSITGNGLKKIISLASVGKYYLCTASNSLFKYYDDSDRSLNTVKSNQIWFSAPAYFNDVFDCDLTVDFKSIFEKIVSLAPIKIKTGSRDWLNLRRNVEKQLCEFKVSYENMKKTTGVCCFSKTCDSLLMWAHYANNHKGMCVEYNLLDINKQLHFSPIPVVYSDERACFNSLDPNQIEIDSFKALIESLTSKSPEWSYENEWRIVRDRDACGDAWNNEKHGALLPMIRPGSVILGCAASNDFEDRVTSFCKSEEINLYKMEKDSLLYKLNKKPLFEFSKNGKI